MGDKIMSSGCIRTCSTRICIRRLHSSRVYIASPVQKQGWQKICKHDKAMPEILRTP